VQLLEPVETARPAADPDLIEEAAKALGASKRPIIFVGGGIAAANATDELRELAEMLQAPVIMSTNGKGALSSRHYLGHDSLAGMDLLPQSDVVFVVGTRFAQPAVATWGPNRQQTVIQMDIDPDEIGRNYQPNIGIIADAKLGLNDLIKRVGAHNRKRESVEEEMTRLKESIEDKFFEVQPQAAFATVIREELPDDGIAVAESTQVGYWMHNAFPVYKPRTYVSSGYQGTLGYGFATALGAQVGNPDKKVVSVNGDGGFMFNVQELSTMAMHHINLVAIVFSDNAYGNVKRIQQQSFNGRTIASTLHNPDFSKLAELFGVVGMRATTPDDLRTVLRSAFKMNEPVLIEVPVGEMPSIWPIVRPQGR
jgi:acetolactate synthase-1/2/3 large subunit